MVVAHAARVRLNHPEPFLDSPVHGEHAEHQRHLTRRRIQLMVERTGRLRLILGLIVCVAVSAAAIFSDLSSFDPFGPGIGWSPGVLLVMFASAFLLVRGRFEE